MGVSVRIEPGACHLQTHEYIFSLLQTDIPQTGPLRTITCMAPWVMLCAKVHQYTVKSLLQARASIRIITVHGDGGGRLLEITSARKVCSSNLSVRVAILIC